MQNILEHIDYWICKTPDKKLYQFLDVNGVIKESYTYQSFDKRTDAIAFHLCQDYQLEVGICSC